MYTLNCGKLNYTFDDKNNAVSLSYVNSLLKTINNADYFRLMLDDGEYRELTVNGAMQTPSTISFDDDALTVVYNNLTAVNGKSYAVELTLTVEKDGDGLIFNAKIKNDDHNIRVNEIQYPYFSFSSLFAADKSQDEMIVPDGLGRKIKNIWTYARDNCHTEYMSADYNQVNYSRPYLLTYPFPLSMSWFGAISDEKFLFLGRLDNQFRTCALNLYNSPRRKSDEIILSVSQYPAVVSGECIEVGQSRLEIFEEGWRAAADYYAKWAQNDWYKPYAKPSWVKNLSGWQRVILRHQYGEIFFYYRDLLRIWKDCKAVGLDGLLIFGWWKGGMDNRYPSYEPDDELGGAEELKKAIADIKADGGKVLLYSNGVLIDTATDYYEKIGQKVCRKDIDGNEYREFYKFSNDGTLLDGFGYKTFVSACQATDEWRRHLIEIGKYKLSYDPDCIFFDQVGGHLPKPCFDKTHKHGNRIDSEAKYRRENLDAIHGLLSEDQAAGTENTVDCFSQYFQFHHGHMCGAWYSDEAFPQMFRQTFPYEIISNRLLHDDREDMQEQLNYAFVHGLILDVSIYRGRKKIIGDLPDYFNAVKKLLALKRKYSEFFYGGKYELTEDYVLPENVFLGEYHSDEKIGFAIWNNTDEPITLLLKGNVFNVKEKETDFFVCKNT